MPDTLLDLDFSDLYLMDDLIQSCYKERSDSLRLLSFSPGLHAELRQFYRFLQSGDKARRFVQTVVRASIEPSVAATHDLDLQLVLRQIALVDVGDF